MEPEVLAGMIFTLILILLIGGFITLLPITRRLGSLIEAKVKEKAAIPDSPDFTPLLEAIHNLEAQVRRLNERQEFTENLIAGRLQPGRSVGDAPKLPAE